MKKSYSALLLALLLLLIVASRAFRLDVDVLDVQTDEAWSVWQTFGTAQDIIRWTPYDWPPLYYLTLGGWRAAVGLHPVTLRWLSVLSFALGSAAFYRSARRLFRDENGGLIAMLAYAAFGYMIFLSTEMRGYALLIAFYPLALWLTQRYFYRPTLSRALLLAITLAAMFYTSLTSVPAIAMLVLFTLFVYGRQVWRWWLPGGIAVLIALPEIIDKARIAVVRTSATGTIQLPPIGEALPELYRIHAGTPFVLWLILAALAIGLIVWGRRPPPQPCPEFRGGSKQSSVLRSPTSGWGRIAIGLVVWALMPLPLYLTNPLLGFFNHRYAWWVMPGVALLLGYGLMRLPSPARLAVAALLIIFAFLPVPFDDYQLGDAPLGESFVWLADHARAGDVLLVDPNCGCGSPETFAVLTRMYFPDGLRAVSEPEGYRRVWYLTGASGATQDVFERVSAGRVAGIFVGPPESLFRLYEAPPDAQGIVYENGMRFHGADLLDIHTFPTFHEGETVRARLWWSVDEPPALDYSVGVYLLDADGRVHAQEDSAPALIYPDDAPLETSRWQPGQIFIEERQITLPPSVGRGDYALKMALYWFGDEIRLTAPGVDADGLLPLAALHVAAW